MLEMKTDKVEPFRKWLTQEALPTLRKTGGYVVDGREEEFINAYFPNFSEETKLQMVQDLRKQNVALKSKNESLINENLQQQQVIGEQTVQITVMKPKADSYRDSKEKKKSKIHTYWTQAGRKFIYELLKSNGHLRLSSSATRQ